MRAARVKPIAFVAALLVTQPAVAQPKEEKWGQWAPADEGLLPLDFRMGLHVTHVSLRSSGVGDGKRGSDYGFDRPAVYVPEMTFSAFTAQHFAFGIMFQPAGFGGQDMAATTPSEHTRTPYLLGVGAVFEGAWSAGPILFRPGIVTGPRVLMLIEDRSGKQSPPAVVQYFVHGRVAAELALSRAFALGAGVSTDALRPLDWGGFGYLAWRVHDVSGATR